jgi:hypothetical protein
VRFSKCSYLRAVLSREALAAAVCPCCRAGEWTAGDEEMEGHTVAWWCSRRCGFRVEVEYATDHDHSPHDRLCSKLLSRGGKP